MPWPATVIQITPSLKLATSRRLLSLRRDHLRARLLQCSVIAPSRSRRAIAGAAVRSCTLIAEDTPAPPSRPRSRSPTA
jgi:hypothetical protein